VAACLPYALPGEDPESRGPGATPTVSEPAARAAEIGMRESLFWSDMKVLRISHSAVVSAWRERERSLLRRGVEVTLLSAQVWDEGGKLVRLEPDGDQFVTGVRTIGRHPILFLYSPLPLWRALGRPWDVVDIHEEPYSLASAEVLLLKSLRRCRAPFVLYSAQNIDKRYPVPFRWIERWTLLHAAGVSICNAEAGHILQRKGLLGEAQLIPLGVDTRLFTPRNGDRDEHAADQFHVGYVGRLERRKGIHVLLDAIAIANRSGGIPIRADVVGGGPYENGLRQRAQQLGIGDLVVFHGHTPQRELPGRYREFDLLAVPSLPTKNWLEQFCRVAVEAMATGIPVVASDSGALPDVIGDAGVLVPPGDPAALSSAIVRVATDADLRHSLKRKGVERARGFRWDEVAAEYEALYTRIAQRRAPLSSSSDRLIEAPPAPPEVVIVAYGSTDDLRNALTIAQHFETAVVDNSSEPDIRIATEAAGARYLNPRRNLGFAGGVNYALARRNRPGADVLLLNPDATVRADVVTSLQRRLHEEPDIACVAPSQVDEAGQPARVAWPFPSPLGSWLEAVGLGRLRRSNDFVIGSVLLLRGSAVSALGGLDERFFLYAEETDWQFRASKAGWRNMLVPEGIAMHIGGATSKNPTRREVHFHASQERYMRKHYGSSGWFAHRAATLLGSCVRAILLRDQRRQLALLRIRLYLKGPVAAERELDGLSTSLPST